MVIVEYLADRNGAESYGSCAGCCKSAKDDPKMVAVSISNQYKQGVTITLCDKCRRELYEKI
jgi:hypothetical protein